MRNNEDRMAVSSETPVLEQPNVNNLNYVIPTEIVELPSKGMFYPTDHPLHQQKTIEIKHMTAKEEDILTSSTYIQQGVVLDYLLQSLIIDKRIDPATLLMGDKNAIFLNARINGYGEEYEVESRCQECGTTDSIVHNLREIKYKVFNKNVEAQDGEISFKLPKLGHVVTVKFLNSKEEAALQREGDKREKLNLPINATTVFLKTIITSINGVLNRGGALYDFIDSLPAMDSKHIKKTYIESQPDIDFTIEVECKKCSTIQGGELPITAEFFWPNS